MAQSSNIIICKAFAAGGADIGGATLLFAGRCRHHALIVAVLTVAVKWPTVEIFIAILCGSNEYLFSSHIDLKGALVRVLANDPVELIQLGRVVFSLPGGAISVVYGNGVRQGAIDIDLNGVIGPAVAERIGHVDGDHLCRVKATYGADAVLIKAVT